MAWNTDRKDRLPSDWVKRRAIVLKRDGHRCVECGKPANQVDHIIAGDDHSFENLRALCRECHGKKSSAEGHAARSKKYSKRPPEKHPGYIQ